MMEKPKVIELTIRPDYENLGVQAIALVEDPAIEVNFLYFNEEPHQLEPEDTLEDFPDESIETVYTDYELGTMIELAKVIGRTEEELLSSGNKYAKKPNTEIVYRYQSSGVAGNSRSFCSALMAANRYYTREEISMLDDINDEFGPGVGGGRYNVFKFKGGANCQHVWQKYEVVQADGRLTITLAQPTTAEERLAATAPRTRQGRGFVKNPQRGLSPLPGRVAFQFADEEKRIIVSPIMIPGKEIIRYDMNNEPYYVVFTAETIREIAMRYMKQARTNDTNINHISSADAGSYLYESWLVETDSDKAITKYGFDVPIGTWCGTFRIDDDKVWAKVKAGELRGVSVEGAFIAAEELENKKVYDKIKDIIGED